MRKAYIFLSDGFEETEAVTTVDVLRRGGVAAQTVSLSNDHIVKGSHGIPVKADLLFCHLEGDDSADMLVLPGGPGHKHYKTHEPLLGMLRRHYKSGKLLAAICAAPVVLGMLGLLSGRNAVCYPGCEGELTGATIGSGDVIASGNIVTAKGPGSATAFAFKLLELLAGRETAEAVARDFIYNNLP